MHTAPTPGWQSLWSCLSSVCRCAVLLAAAAQALAAPAGPDYYLRPFSDQSPWNTPLVQAPDTDRHGWSRLDLGEDAHVHINSNSWSIPFYLAGAEVPERPIYIRKLQAYVMAPVPEGALPAEGTDGHLTVMSADRTTIHEFFRFEQPGQANIYRRVEAAGLGVAEQAGRHIGTRAYGGSAVGGLLRQWELEQGVARHALAVALSLNFLKSGYVAPATSEDDNSEANYGGSIPMGALLALPPELEVEALLEQPLAILIAKTLQRYGGYVVDSGGSDAILFYAEPGFDNKAVARSANELDKIIPHLRLVGRQAAGD
ncbi:hypothetical protein FV139_19355 [Parahaliea maris]|uniref:Uncharacterized protein n=1 Tax=Parahaliea maris TaxID=2716870 RepID=A0A5C8ZNS6_9GAMM|nr:hypothetical protein [Parahaliea maris]TXS89885.1 hypothetical protein FV139_19355 [Parahaliea maris]